MEQLRGKRELAVICNDEPDTGFELNAELTVGGVAQLDLDERDLGGFPNSGGMIFFHPGRMSPNRGSCEFASRAAAASLTPYWPMNLVEKQ